MPRPHFATKHLLSVPRAKIASVGTFAPATSLPQRTRRILVATNRTHRTSATTYRPPRTQLFHTHSALKMSDQDYEAFLNKANEGAGGASTQSKKVGTKSVNTGVPKALEQVEEYYVSDADEPFEPVALSYDGGEDISAQELKGLIGHDAEVVGVSEKDFDPRGQYKKVLDAVKAAGSGKVSVFRVEHGGTRSEYYVVSVDSKGGKVVGLKALSVES